MILKLPTAWLQLKHNKLRLLVAIGGISFAVTLLFMQFGLQAALFDSAVNLYKTLQGDYFLLSTRSSSLIAMDSFAERYLYQALAFEEVQSVIPVYLGFAQWKNPQTRKSWRSIYVIGFDPSYQVFNMPGLQENLQQLTIPDTVLFDEASRAEFGPIASELKQGMTVTTEVGDRGPGTRKIMVIGLVKIGTSFGADGNLVTSDLNFLRIFKQRQKRSIDLGVIQLKADSDINQLRQKIKHFYPENIKIFSKQELIEFEKNYWRSGSAISFIFTQGVVVGLIIGVVIVYQILYANVSDHLAEYATLRAMGYRHSYLLSIVLQESLILAILGYIPGFILASILYKVAHTATLLPINMEAIRALLVLLLAFLMCLVSGTIAVGKLQDADPADIF